MREQGTATKVDGRIVTVRIGLAEGCAACSSHRDCSIAGKELDALIPEGETVAVGDLVELDAPDAASAAGALWLLAIPLALFFAAYLGVGAAFPGTGEGPKAAAGLGAMALGILLAVTAGRRGRMSSRPTARRIA